MSPPDEVRPPTDGRSAFEPDVVVTCLKRRFTGVSGTVNALLPWLAEELRIAYVGEELPGVALAERQHPANVRRFGLWKAIRLGSGRPRSSGRKLVWHVRRNHELLLAIVLRDVLRQPIRVLFTSAAIRRHSLLPRWLIARAQSQLVEQQAAGTAHAAVSGDHRESDSLPRGAAVASLRRVGAGLDALGEPGGPERGNAPRHQSAGLCACRAHPYSST